MTDGKRKKSKSDPFEKKLKPRVARKRKTSFSDLPPLPPDDDSDIMSESSSKKEKEKKESDEQKDGTRTPEEDDPENLSTLEDPSGKNPGKSIIEYKKDSAFSSKPNNIFIFPFISGINDEEEGPISLEDAFEFPLNSTRKRAPLKLQSRKKSPLRARIDKAKEDIDKYNKEFFPYDVKKHPLKDQILLMDLDLSTKSMILKKLDDQEKSKNSFDQSKFMNWIKDILQLPFGKKVPLPILLSDGPRKIKNYLDKARDQLNAAIAGQDHAKDEIIDFIARLIANPHSKGNILALYGERGTGKTKLVRRGVAEALGRPFHVINLGGMNDVHVLTGHDMTYSGAKYGRLAQILIQSQCENPVIYLDEIDKVQSGSDKGMEIFRVLTHVLDEEQNHEFFDEYFAGIKIDLSKILFVASMNNPDDVDPILRDRLKLIHVKSLDLSTKLNIFRNYLLPELCSEVSMTTDELLFSDDVIKYLIKSKTEEEDGCRQLKRKLETIVQKLNTQRITATGYFEHLQVPEIPEIAEEVNNIERDGEKTDHVEDVDDVDQVGETLLSIEKTSAVKPIHIDTSIIDVLLKNSELINKIPFHIYM